MDIEELKTIKAEIDDSSPCKTQMQKEIQVFFRQKVQELLDYWWQQYVRNGSRWKRNAYMELRERGLLSVKDIIKMYNEIESRNSVESSRIRDFVSGICNQAYAKTFLKFAKVEKDGNK